MASLWWPHHLHVDGVYVFHIQCMLLHTLIMIEWYETCMHVDPWVCSMCVSVYNILKIMDVWCSAGHVPVYTSDHLLMLCHAVHFTVYTIYTQISRARYCQVHSELHTILSTLAEPGRGEASSSVLPTLTLSCDLGGYPLSVLEVHLRAYSNWQQYIFKIYLKLLDSSGDQQ